MERIGAGVIIRGNGNEDFNVMVNGMASQEWQRLNAKYIERMEAQRREFEKEIERMKMIKRQRSEQRWKEMEKNYGTLEEHNPTMCERIKEKIVFVLACLICWDIIQYVGGNENE